ncbi:MAG: dihydrofolate reductase family protein [Polyangiales bacterium]
MRKLIYYVSTTADGFIATASGGFDVFLQDGEHMPDMLAEYPETLPAHVRAPLGIADAPNRRFDAVLMGRATYAVGLPHGVTSPYPHLAQYVVSKSLTVTDPTVQQIAADPLRAVRELKQKPGLDIWLCGGGVLAAELAPELDELILKQHPVVIGAGTPLFARAITPARMRLLDHRTYANGYQRLHYSLRG